MQTHTCKAVSKVLLASTVLLFLAGECVAQSPRASASQAGAQPVVRITQAIDDTQVVKLRGNVHPLARPEFDQGAVADSTPMNRMLLLLRRSPEQEAALLKLLDEQQIKSSPNFHKWLTPAEFGRQFGPADADIQQITNWLVSQGFQNIRVGAGRTAIEFSGNAAAVTNAFHTGIHKFRFNGELRQANLSDPEIPAALSPVVAGIVSLHNFPRKSYRHVQAAFQETAQGRIVSQMTTTSGCGPSHSQPCYAIGPADFATIYNSLPLLTAASPIDGTGVKIAIVGVSNINPQDVNDFRSLFGLPTNPPNIIFNGPDPGMNGAEGEGDLDVQWSGAAAPGATIDFVVSEDTLTASGVDLSAFYVVDNNSDDIMSLSFGVCEKALGTAGNAFYDSLWQQAAAQGISVTVSSGDPGSAGCDDFNTATTATRGLAVSGIASTPFNVSVGGTDFDDVGTQTNFWNSTNSLDGKRESAKGYIPETTWNESCAATATMGNLTTCVGASTSLLNIVGGSGGPSNCATSTISGTTITCTGGRPKPAYQTQSGLTPADNVRDTPDVSLFASTGPASDSFYVMCQADALPAGSSPSCNPASTGKFSFFGVGGTSASSPAFAGILALVNQKMGGRQGNANVILYKIAQSEIFSNCNSTTTPLSGSPSCVFYDITKGNNSVPCAGGSPNCSSSTSGTNGVLVDPANPTTPAWMTKTGYDMATGLGSVNVANLANAWPTAVSTFRGTTTSLVANTPTTITHGQSVSFTATVSPATGTGTPTGDVALLGPVGTTNSGGFGNLLSNGTTTITTSLLPGGTYSVKAYYAGDTTFAPSSSNSIPVSVTRENSHLQMGIVTFSLTGALTSTNATSFEYGSPYILRMDILNSTGTSSNCQPLVVNGVTSGCAVDARGSVTVTDNGNLLDAGTFGINSQGNAEDQPIQLPAGTHSLSANYSGDLSYNPSGPVTATLTVLKATTTATVISSASSIVSGATVTLTATVNSSSNSSAGPSGTVQFQSNGSNLGSPVTCAPKGFSGGNFASCTAILVTTLSALPPGLLDTQPRHYPPVVLVLLVTLCVLLLLLLSVRLPARRCSFRYAGVIFFLLVAAGISGCGGGGSSPRTLSITGHYGGDANYAASTSAATTITVQ